MRHFLATTSFLLVTLSVSTHAAGNKKNSHPTPKIKNPCSTLTSCTDHVSNLLGHKYIYTDKLEGNTQFSKNVRLNKENIEKYFSESLNLNGYTRVKLEDNIFRIIKSRDVRYAPTNVINIKDYNTASIPRLSDYMIVSMTLKNHEYPSEITRALRPFLSRYARIITSQGSQSIIVQDTGRNLIRVVDLVKKLDKELTSDAKERIEKKLAQRHEAKIHKKDSCCE